MNTLYRVVEKTWSPGRRRFSLEGGVWHARLELVQEIAARLAPVSLAHRMFIVHCIGKGHSEIVDEIDLAPLDERLEYLHQVVLQSRDPSRLAAEALAREQGHGWRRRLPRPPST